MRQTYIGLDFTERGESQFKGLVKPWLSGENLVPLGFHDRK